MKKIKNILLIIFLAVALLTINIIVHAQDVYYPKYRDDIDMIKVKSHITKMLNGRTTIFDKKKNINGTPKDILVLDDRIEFKINHQNTIICFSDILDDNISTQETTPVDGSYHQTTCQLQLQNFIFYFKSVNREYFSNCVELADDFFFIQYLLNIKRYDSLIINFKPIAAKYCALKVKPPISEEQREYIVQANSYNQQKMYDKTVEIYKKAIEINQTDYPAAYSNLALLSAQIHKIDAAIYYMKKYLLLVPDASDARSVQDKIYEWKAQLPKY